MQTSYLTTVRNLGLVLLTVLFLATSIHAADSKTKGKEINKNTKLSLIEGIKSSNLGIKRDCIYFAAVYEIKEAVDALKSQLKKEKDPSTRVLISLALYKLGESRETDEIYGSALIDWNEKVQNMSNEIVNLYKDPPKTVASFNGD